MARSPPLTLKARALQCLTQREHSRIELRRKLIAHAARLAADAERPSTTSSGPPARDDDEVAAEAAVPSFTRRVPATPEAQARVDTLLDELAAQGLLSEARFIETRVRARVPRHGNLRIRQELAQHGLTLAPDAAAALKESEFSRAREVWSRRFDAPPADAAGHAKQVRFLAGRGFSAEVIRRLLRGDDD